MGAAVMFGSRSGVPTLFKEKFPSIVVWHCANRRLELSINDAVKEVGGMNKWTSLCTNVRNSNIKSGGNFVHKMGHFQLQHSRCSVAKLRSYGFTFLRSQERQDK
ncbi:hypothetical protein PR048_024092 [Dryococelus australis]|uniref:Uncharacterized protein n=1 Tax=Dryococelus australis TaxID=614101 RepID=A0ABQ9GVZ3_9NEOP|nr:hypothetical protein PR048_024092 [Dryococelus australis]